LPIASTTLCTATTGELVNADLYIRLVNWDAALLHSATTYDHFNAEGTAPTPLAQLFFFDI
jgi:hypothetical protein